MWVSPTSVHEEVLAEQALPLVCGVWSKGAAVSYWTEKLSKTHCKTASARGRTTRPFLYKHIFTRTRMNREGRQASRTQGPENPRPVRQELKGEFPLFSIFLLGSVSLLYEI